MNKIKTIIGIIAVPIFCLLLSFFVLITDQNFTYILLSDVSIKESIPVTHQLMSAFAGLNEIPTVFDENEKSHLVDVKILIWIGFLAFILSAIAVLKTVSLGIAKKGALLLFAILFFSAVIPFDVLFDVFHKIFFPEGNWMFAADSTLITFYPFDFFIKFAQAIAIHALLAAGLIIYLETVTKLSRHKKI